MPVLATLRLPRLPKKWGSPNFTPAGWCLNNNFFRVTLVKVNGNDGKKCDKAELSNVEGSATPQRLRTPAIGLMAIYGSRGNAPTLKNYALPSDLEAKSLECDDYA